MTQAPCSVAGYDALRTAVIEQLRFDGLLLSAHASAQRPVPPTPRRPSPAEDIDERTRLVALVDLARDGDVEAFGQLYDHYNRTIYRYVYYRVSSQQLAEDLTSETFFKALRGLGSFHWQGKDFGAWLVTIARNLVVDHAKRARTRLESPSDSLEAHSELVSGPEDEVLDQLTNAVVEQALRKLPTEQRECIVLRFLQSMSITETAQAMNKTEGAIKQLQLRAIRNLARRLPPDLRQS